MFNILKVKSLRLTFTLVFFLILNGCAAPHPYELELDSTDTRKIVEPMSKEKEIQMTYNLKYVLSDEELLSFSKNIKSPANAKYLSELIKENASSPKEFNEALITRPLSNYYVPASETVGMNNFEVTLMSRQKTLDAIKHFFNNLNYQVICETGCINDFEASGSSSYKIWLGIKQKQDNNIDFATPTALQINLTLPEMVENKGVLHKEATHAASNYWLLSIRSPNRYAGMVKKNGLEYNDLRSYMNGTILNKKFFEHLTSELKGFSHVWRGAYNIHYHIKEAFYSGKTYDLKTGLEGVSLINGLRID